MPVTSTLHPSAGAWARTGKANMKRNTEKWTPGTDLDKTITGSKAGEDSYNGGTA